MLPITTPTGVRPRKRFVAEGLETPCVNGRALGVVESLGGITTILRTGVSSWIVNQKPEGSVAKPSLVTLTDDECEP